MIYYIVAIDPKTHNEWVMSTHDSVVSATKYCDEYRKQNTGYEYRIDTAEQNIIGLMAEAAKTWKNPLSDFQSTEVEYVRFTAQELFPPRNNIPTSDCAECGAYVRLPQHVKHAEWHNKVADL